MRGVYYRTEKDGTPLATPELRISATNNRTVYYDNQNAKEAALQNNEIKEGSIVLTGYADGESEVVIKQQPDWENAETLTVAQLQSGYVVPSDGYVCLCCLIDSSLNTYVTITVNGVGIATAWSAVNNVAYSVGQAQCQVNKGDVIRLVNDLNVPLIPYGYNPFNFVPFKTVAEPLTLPVNVMNNPSLPDWGRAISITAAQLQAGYVCPSNGMIVGVAWKDNQTSEIMFLKINGVTISGSIFSTSSDRTFANVQVSVEGGNVLTLTGATTVASNLSFVPFKN